MISLQFLPVGLIMILVLFVFAGLPFYWFFSVGTWFFTGLHLPVYFAIYGSHLWGALSVALFLTVGGFYLPFQKVFLYVLYRELKDLKTDSKELPA